MLSIIIPTRNEEKVIGDTLDRLAKYTGPHEVIVSDGGSTDQTVAIAQSHGAVVVQKSPDSKQNIAMGRNAGAARASGDFLLFIDADVAILEPDDFFARALKLFADDPTLTGLTVSMRVFPQMATLGDRIMHPILDAMSVFNNNITKQGGAGGDFQLVRASAFKAIGGFNENLVAGEDFEHFRRLAKQGHVRYEGSLRTYQTGRRAHKVGWPKLLAMWLANDFSTRFFKRAVSTEWKVIR